MSAGTQVTLAGVSTNVPPAEMPMGRSAPARCPSVDGGDDFRSGRPHVLPGGAAVRFDDGRWTLQEAPLVTVGFDDLPAWLREPTKRYASVLWLDEGKPAGTVRAGVGAARWWGRTLGDTAVRDLRDLSADHVRQVRDRLAEEGERARAALEAAHAAAQHAGLTLTSRDRRSIVRRAGGRVNPSQVSGQIDAICEVSRTQLGWEVSFHVGSVENPAVEKRGPWSADASKVVSYEARQAFVAVLDAEIAAYEAVRGRIRELLAAADYDELAAKLGRHATGGANLAKKPKGRPIKAAYARLVLECYLGLGGRPMHSNDALAAALQLARSSGASIARQAKGYLALYMDVAAVTQITRLRQAIMYRKKPLVGHDPERVGLLALARAHGLPGAAEALAEMDGGGKTPRALSTSEGVAEIALPAAEVGADRAAIEAYFGFRDGTLWSLEDINAIYGYGDEVGVSSMGRRRMMERLPLLLGEAVAEELLRLRGKHNLWLSRAVKASAVKLELAVARRVNALLKLEVEPKVETHHLGGTMTVVIHFRAEKGWGDLGALDRVPCPGELAHLAVEAIAKAQELTAPLRVRAGQEAAGRLFLIPDQGVTSTGVIALRDHSLHEYVFSAQEGRDPGVLGRYTEELSAYSLDGFTLHHSRHTNATHLMEGGASATTISTYLGHNAGWNGREATNTQQATVFYVAGGTESMRAVRAEHLSRGEGTGYLLDALLRVGVEGVPESERVGWKGALELPLEEAMRRIQEADILQPVPLTVEDAKRRLAERGLPVMTTVWGGCLLPAEDGECPAGPNGCSIGTHPNDPAVKQGCGCRWRALLPVAVHHLEDDLALIKGQLEVAEARPELASARSKLRTELSIKEMELATARRLNLLPSEGA